MWLYLLNDFISCHRKNYSVKKMSVASVLQYTVVRGYLANFS